MFSDLVNWWVVCERSCSSVAEPDIYKNQDINASWNLNTAQACTRVDIGSDLKQGALGHLSVQRTENVEIMFCK